MAAQLAPIFLDNNRIVLQGDPKPNVTKILTNAGKSAGKVQVVRLEAQGDTEGAPLRDNDVIDRTMEQTPIYLHCLESSVPGTPSYGTGTSPSAPMPSAPSKTGGGKPSFEGGQSNFTRQQGQGQGPQGRQNQQPKQPWKQTAQEEGQEEPQRQRGASPSAQAKEGKEAEASQEQEEE